jgi:hypothetical protein
MSAGLTRVLLLLACVALLVPLSGASSMMAQEEETIQCFCDSEEARMSLQYLASGGAVTGTYTSLMVTEEPCVLFDEDGSSEEYLEARTVMVSVELAGTYSLDAPSPFSLQLNGTGSVDIDNTQDDRFDRSYEVTLHGTAAGDFNEDGSLTLSGITAEFTPQQTEAGEIPNTEWLEPPAAFMPTELTLACQPLGSAAAPPITDCSVSIIPDPVGPQDTVIQAEVVPTGFRAPMVTGWSVNGPATNNVVIGPMETRTTFTWPGAPLSPGFYSIEAFVSEDYPGPYYFAECAAHFSIGDVKNSPPECVITDLSPAVPSVGDTSLEVSVQGRDADGEALTYWFDLMGWLGAPGVDVGPRYTFSIPGGLQPGTYTVMVTVKDGQYRNYCSRNLLISDTTQPPGASPPMVPKGAPIARPPQPPQPPAAPPQPPAPPPVPPPTEGCGPVQVIYLDDLGVPLNEADIDAFIENTLAHGGPDLSLIISHRQSLVDRYTEQGFAQIDGLLQDLGNIAETCPFVLIVGDPDVIPFAVLPNPTSDGDVLYTDDVYGDNDHDVLGVPDIPVARIPDGWSLDLLVTQLSSSDVPEGGDFTLANSKRPHAGGVASQVFGENRVLLWSLPAQHGELDSSQVNVRQGYFMLHGGAWDTSVWWGEEDVYPEAFTVREARSEGIVLSGACYGSYTFGRTPRSSITLSFLESGARAFVGSTGITYSPLWTSGPNPTGPLRHDALFHQAFLSAVSGGQAPLAAFMEAKDSMADLCRTADSTGDELKMLHEYIYFGKP